jgi:tripartite-type tricarboxylate transporter receptor subunit TctC
MSHKPNLGSHASGLPARRLDRRSFVVGLAAAAGLISVRGLALAQEKYPDRPIVIIVPYAAGGALAVFGQRLVARMAPHLGGSLVIDPKGGAGGVIGTKAVASARADGYTLLLAATGSQIISPLTYAHPPFDPVKDFVPIALLTRQPMVLAINPTLNVTSLQGLIALLKQSPNKHSYASAGIGALGHLTGELFLKEAGVQAVHVPYKGGGPALADVVAGNVAFTWEVMSAVMPFHTTGRLRIISVADDKRAPSLPDVPTAAESGLTNLVAQTQQFLLAPAATPAPVVARLAEAVRRAMSEEEFRRDLIAGGIEPVADSTLVSTGETIRRELDRWRPLVKALDLRAAS